MKKGIHNELEQARMAIEGALNNPAIIQQLVPLGYDRKKIQQGKALYEKVWLLKDLRSKEDSNKCDATDQLQAAKQEADMVYKYHLKVARLAIPKDRKHWLALELNGARKKDMTGWLAQTQAFYANTEEVEDMLAGLGISPEELAQARAMIEAVAAGRVKQNGSKSNAQQAIAQRDAAREELQQWMKKFIKAARYVFDENKQQLEALGVVVRSS